MTYVPPSYTTANLSKLPSPSGVIPTVDSGTVHLYANPHWKGNSLKISIKDVRENKRQSISGLPERDQATWVVFNLPLGVVLTLMDNFVPNDNCADLSNCGGCIDLCGTGETVAVDLGKVGMNDCVTAYFWRNVDMAFGAIELWENIRQGGNRNVIFLSEWQSGKKFSITRWHLQDRISSADWSTLPSTTWINMFANADGTGNSYENICGWTGIKSVSNFSDFGMNDKISSFEWGGLIPQKTVVGPIQVTYQPETSQGLIQTSTINGINDTASPQQSQISLAKEVTTTTTVSATETHTINVQLTVSASYSPPDATGGYGGSISLQLGYLYSLTTEKSVSQTVTTNNLFTQNFNADPYSTYTATLTVEMQDISNLNYTGVARRWYGTAVPGSTFDSSNGLYMRDEQIAGTIDAQGVACSAIVDMVTNPIVK